ncbi:MAG: recombinase family protein [Enterococcus sp.]
MKTIGYVRTSITDSDSTTQFQALQSYGCDQIFLDTFEEPAIKEAQADLSTVISTLAPSDALVVSDLYRLGYSTRQLTELTSHFQAENIHLVSLSEAIDTRSNHGTRFFQLMDDLAKMEGSLIKERTLVGLDNARKNGKVGGRPKVSAKTVQKIRRLYYEKKETIQFIATKCNVSVGTCYKYINLSEEECSKLAK